MHPGKDSEEAAPGTSGRCRGLFYTQTMEWDPDKLKVGTLRPNDPLLKVGTITSDKIVAGALKRADGSPQEGAGGSS